MSEECTRTNIAATRQKQRQSHNIVRTERVDLDETDVLQRHVKERQDSRKREQKALVRLADHRRSLGRRISANADNSPPEAAVSEGVQLGANNNAEETEGKEDEAEEFTARELIKLIGAALAEAYPDLDRTEKSTSIQYSTMSRHQLTMGNITTVVKILGLADHLECSFEEAHNLLQAMCLSSRSITHYITKIACQWHRYLTAIDCYQEGVEELAARDQYNKDIAQQKRRAKRSGEVWIPPPHKTWCRSKRNVKLPQRDDYQTRYEKVNWEEYVAIDEEDRYCTTLGMTVGEQVQWEKMVYPRYCDSSRSPSMSPMSFEEREITEEPDQSATSCPFCGKPNSPGQYYCCLLGRLHF